LGSLERVVGGLENNDGLKVDAHITLNIGHGEGVEVEVGDLVLGSGHHGGNETLISDGLASHEPEERLAFTAGVTGEHNRVGLVVGVEHVVVGVVGLVAEETDEARSDVGVGALGLTGHTKATAKLISGLTGVGDSEVAISGEAGVLGGFASPAVLLEILVLDVSLLVPDSHVGFGIEESDNFESVTNVVGFGELGKSVVRV
jgi:hypothetical protein